MIKPTVGRVVLYTPHADEKIGNVQKLPAIVADVFGDRCVNLSVFHHSGDFAGGRTSVDLIQDDDPKPEGRYCEWMPFQRGATAIDQTVATLATKVLALEQAVQQLRMPVTGPAAPGTPPPDYVPPAAPPVTDAPPAPTPDPSPVPAPIDTPPPAGPTSDGSAQPPTTPPPAAAAPPDAAAPADPAPATPADPAQA